MSFGMLVVPEHDHVPTEEPNASTKAGSGLGAGGILSDFCCAIAASDVARVSVAIRIMECPLCR